MLERQQEILGICGVRCALRMVDEYLVSLKAAS